MDNIFCVFENEHQALTFLDFLNSQHPNLNFTKAKKHMKQLPFLDVLSTYSDKLPVSIGIVHSQDFYRIAIVFTYTKGLTKTLIDQTFHLNNTWDGFHLDLEKLKVILQKNEYPPKSIDKSVNRYLNKMIMNKPSETEPSKTKENMWYFKLPL